MSFDLNRIGGQPALNKLVAKVLVAGNHARRLYEAGQVRTEKKADRSPVTQADQEVEEILRDHLLGAFPDCDFVGEETEAAVANKDLRWFVDPIDGTRAFVRGIDTWSVLVGLEDFSGLQPESVLGVAFMPAKQELFVGVLGGGVLHNGRPLSGLSSTQHAKDAMVCHGGLEQFQERWDLLQRVGQSVYSARGFGDFEGYRRLLLGQADAMIDPGIKPYDICPAAAMVRELGGRFTDFAGTPTIHEPSALATNGYIHDEMLALVR